MHKQLKGFFNKGKGINWFGWVYMLEEGELRIVDLVTMGEGIC